MHLWIVLHIDHFLISENMGDDITGCDIVDSGVNFSDHLPVLLDIHLPMSNSPYDTNVPTNYKKKHSRLR